MVRRGESFKSGWRTFPRCGDWIGGSSPEIELLIFDHPSASLLKAKQVRAGLFDELAASKTAET